MQIDQKPTPEGSKADGETIVTSFEYKGEAHTKKKKENEVISAILDLLVSQPSRKFTSQDIEIELQDKFSNPTRIREVLPKMRSQRLLAYDVNNRPYSYWSYEEDEEY